VKERIPKKRKEIKVKFEGKGLTFKEGLVLMEEHVNNHP
jgi:hypothetical protein